MGPSVTTVYLPRQLMGLQCVVTLSSYMAEYERVSQAEGEREPLHVKESLKCCDCNFDVI